MIFRLRHYELTTPNTPCETLIRVDQIATMPGFDAGAVGGADWPWLGTLVLVSGHKMEVLADLSQWNLLTEAVLSATHG